MYPLALWLQQITFSIFQGAQLPPLGFFRTCPCPHEGNTTVVIRRQCSKWRDSEKQSNYLGLIFDLSNPGDFEMHQFPLETYARTHAEAL